MYPNQLNAAFEETLINSEETQRVEMKEYTILIGDMTVQYDFSLN